MMNNKLDLKDPKNHIAYYEISDNHEQIIVHLQAGKSFCYPYSKEQEMQIIKTMKEQTGYLKEEKSQLQNKLVYWENACKLAPIIAAIILSLPLGITTTFFFYDQISLSNLILVFISVSGLAFTTIYTMKYRKKEYETKIERIELLEDIMDSELLKEKEYNKVNILVNTSNKIKKSQSTKTDYTKNELINEMSRLSLNIKNLKDLRTMAENIQYMNMLNKDTEKEEKKYLKK